MVTADLLQGSNAIEFRHFNVHGYQIRLVLLSRFDGCEAVASSANHADRRIAVQGRDDEVPGDQRILNHQHTYRIGWLAHRYGPPGRTWFVPLMRV